MRTVSFGNLPKVPRALAPRMLAVARSLARWPSEVVVPLPTGGELRVRASHTSIRTFADRDLAAIALARTGFALQSEDGAALLVVDGVQAAALVAGCLGAPAVSIATRPLGGLERGIVAAMVATALARNGWGAIVDPDADVVNVPVDRPLVILNLVFALSNAPAADAATCMMAQLVLPGDSDRPGALHEERHEGRYEERLERLDRLQVDAVIELGRTTLASQDLAAACVGDVVVFTGLASPFVPEDVDASKDTDASNDTAGTALQSVHLRIGCMTAAANLSSTGRLVLTGAFSETLTGLTNTETAMSDDNHADAPVSNETSAVDTIPEHQGASVGAVDSGTLPDFPRPSQITAVNAAAVLARASVEVVAEIGRVGLRGDEVAGLMAGHVLDLGDLARGAITLTVSGRVVAQGELVDLDGHLGVRLTHLA